MGIEGIERVSQPVGGREEPLEAGFEEGADGLFEADDTAGVTYRGARFGDHVEAGDFVEEETGEDEGKLPGEGDPRAAGDGDGRGPRE